MADVSDGWSEVSPGQRVGVQGPRPFVLVHSAGEGLALQCGRCLGVTADPKVAERHRCDPMSTTGPASLDPPAASSEELEARLRRVEQQVRRLARAVGQSAVLEAR